MEGVKVQSPLSSARSGSSKRSQAADAPSEKDAFMKLLQERKDAVSQPENKKPEDSKLQEADGEKKDVPVKGGQEEKEVSFPKEPVETEGEVLQQAVLQQQAAQMVTVTVEEPQVQTEQPAAVEEVTVAQAISVEQPPVEKQAIKEPEAKITEAVTEEPQAKDIIPVKEMEIAERPKEAAGDATPDKEVAAISEQPHKVSAVKEEAGAKTETGTERQESGKSPRTEKAPDFSENNRNAVQEAAYGAQSFQKAVREETTTVPTERTAVDVPLKTTEQTLPEDLGHTLAAKLPETGRTLTVELEPASLGKLTIRLVYEGDRAAVSILANNPRTLELLNQKASEIAAILEEKTGQETVIYTQPAEPNQDQSENDGHQGQGGQERQESRQQSPEKEKHQADSFAQQLRLGLI